MSDISKIEVDGVLYDVADLVARAQLQTKASVEEVATKASKTELEEGLAGKATKQDLANLVPATNAGVVVLSTVINGWHLKVYSDNTFIGYKILELDITSIKKTDYKSRGIYVSKEFEFAGPLIHIDNKTYCCAFKSMQAVCRQIGIGVRTYRYGIGSASSSGASSNNYGVNVQLYCNASRDAVDYVVDLFVYGTLELS